MKRYQSTKITAFRRVRIVSGEPIVEYYCRKGNPNSAADVNWSSLIGNPPYPTYAGNHAAIGTSQSPILALIFGRDDIRFQHTWEGAGGATRSYAGFTAMANEEDRSRVYGGIHFTFDQTAGQSAGRNVANYVFLNFMKPRCNN